MFWPRQAPTPALRVPDPVPPVRLRMAGRMASMARANTGKAMTRVIAMAMANGTAIGAGTITITIITTITTIITTMAGAVAADRRPGITRDLE